VTIKHDNGTIELRSTTDDERQAVELAVDLTGQ
jgi:hypothetical protein